MALRRGADHDYRDGEEDPVAMESHQRSWTSSTVRAHTIMLDLGVWSAPLGLPLWQRGLLIGAHCCVKISSTSGVYNIEKG